MCIGVREDFDGVQYTILSDLYRYLQPFIPHIHQLVMRASINENTLVDTVGREGEQAWNMWATQQYLLNFAAISSHKDRGRNQPLQFSQLLRKADVSTEYGSYLHTFALVVASSSAEPSKGWNLNEARIQQQRQQAEAWQPVKVLPLRGHVPLYCKMPSAQEDEIMQEWILGEMRVRCHLTRLGVPCDRNRPYDAFIPCEQDLMNYLADDYASSKGW
jgi:hypothetical protein